MTDEYADIREQVQKLCAQYPGEYWRELDVTRTYPTEFVKALTEAGYLSVLIPEEFGGSGLGISAAAAIMEEIQKSGCNGGACHAQMYTMGTLLRHGSPASRRPEMAAGASPLGRTAPPGLRRDRALERHRHAERCKTTARARRPAITSSTARRSGPARAEHSDLMLLLARTTPKDQVETQGRRAVGLSGRPARGGRPRRHDPADPHDDQPRHHRGLLRRSGDSGRQPDRRGGQGLPLYPRRHERRAHPDRRRMHRRCPLVHKDKATDYANERQVFGRPIGKNQGIQFPIAEAYAATEAANG